MTDNIPNAYSFWQLLSQYKIEIPVIQRDYAQGRKDDKAKSIRKEMIEKMLSALSVSDGVKHLSLDFVYGRVADGVFIPIDGQQRLTTLWLLHVYLFKRCVANYAKSCGTDCLQLKSSILSHFTYATRQSSREFCGKLVSNDILPNVGEMEKSKSGSGQQDEENKVGPIERHCIDQSWFYPGWKSDPTVDGMMRTLDEIHLQMEEANYNAAAFIQKLVLNECPITFQFLDMEKHDLTDDLYLNMNARGLPLTEFENFKASLEKYLSNNNFRNALNTIVASLKPKVSEDPTWSKIATDTPEKKIIWKLEHDWHDVFWDKRTPDPVKTEQQMMSLFRRHFLNVWRLNNKYDDDMSKALTPPVNGFSFTPFSVYEMVLGGNLGLGIDVALKPIINFFEALVHHGDEITETKPSWPEELWRPLEGKWKNEQETSASRIRFFAVIKCFSEPTKDVCLFKVSEGKGYDSKYMEWMRIVWNILENAEVDNEKGYQSGLKLIDNLGNYWYEILNWLSSDEPQIDSSLSKEQILEERQKAKNMHEFRDTIKNAESIFKGTIRFLYRDETGTPNWETFNLKSKNAAQFFTSAGLKNDKAVEFVTAFIKQFPSWINNDCYMFMEELDSWKKMLRDEKFQASCHTIFTANKLSSLKEIELNGAEGQQMRVKTQLFADGVVDYLIKYYGSARFRWLGDRFRLYTPNSKKRDKDILFDTGTYQRNEWLCRCLEDFMLQTDNERIGNSRLFIGEKITIKIPSEHRWKNSHWENRWYNGNDTNHTGCLVFDRLEKGIDYAVEVWPSKLTVDGGYYSVRLFRREGKTEGDIWIEKARASLVLEQYGMSLEGDRYWVNDLSVDKTLSCISTIIKQPFS